MNIILLRTYLSLSRWGIVAWSTFMVLYGLLILYLYGSLREAQGLEQYIQSLPRELLVAVGAGGGDASFLFSNGVLVLEAWLPVEYISWWPVVVGVYAVIYCGGALPRDAEQGVLENLLSQPVRRPSLVLHRFLAFLAVISILAFTSWAGVLLGAAVFGHAVGFSWLALALVHATLATGAIAAYSLFLSCLFLDSRKAPAIAGAVTAALYLLNVMGPAMDSVRWLQKLSLFYYFRPVEVMAFHQYNWNSLLVYGGVMVVSVLVALWVFERRDIVS